MSSILSGLIQKEMKSAFGDEMIDNDKFADAIAKAIQQYLLQSVKVLPGQATAGGPTAQATVTPGILDPK